MVERDEEEKEEDAEEEEEKKIRDGLKMKIVMEKKIKEEEKQKNF